MHASFSAERCVFLLDVTTDNGSARLGLIETAGNESILFEELGKANIRLGPRIVGGKEAPPGRFPYMCSLRRRSSQEHVCGGTLIRDRWVVTAAHCLANNEGTGLGNFATVFCGTHSIDTEDPKHVFYSEKAYWPSKWNGSVAGGYDIGLVKLDRKARFTRPRMDTVGAVFRTGDIVAAIGWGHTEAEETSPFLRVAEKLVYIPLGLCAQFLEHPLPLYVMCAGLEGQDTCRGGPLLIANKPKGVIAAGKPRADILVGITSFGAATCDGYAPGVYTRISFFLDWIADTIAKHKHPEPEDAEEKGRKSEVEAVSEQLKGLSHEQMPQSMMNAIQEDDDITVEALVILGFDPFFRYYDSKGEDLLLENGCTMLHWAAAYDSVQCTEVLLRYGAPIDAQDEKGRAPLHIAAGNGKTEVAEVLIDKGADIEAKERFGWTPLIWAGYKGQSDVAEVLIKRGADINAREDDAATALHWAAWNGHSDVAEVLINAGLDVDVEDKFGKTPLHLAAQWGRFEVAELLLDKGASKSKKDDSGDTPFDIICKDDFLPCNSEIKSLLESLLSPDGKPTT